MLRTPVSWNGRCRAAEERRAAGDGGIENKK